MQNLLRRKPRKLQHLLNWVFALGIALLEASKLHSGCLEHMEMNWHNCKTGENKNALGEGKVRLETPAATKG